MTQSMTQPGTERRRVLLLALILLGVAGGVTVVGILTSPDNSRTGTDPKNCWSEGMDEEALLIATRSMPELDEIEKVRVASYMRKEQTILPIFQRETFERILELSQHPNEIARLRAVILLGSDGFAAKNEPFASDPDSVSQMARSRERVAMAITDACACVRGCAFQMLGSQGDNRFVIQAKEALKSRSDQERTGAQLYLALLAKRKPVGK